MGELILLNDYARQHGKNPVVVTQKAERGTFATARKIGRQWFIDEDEPYTDARVTHGKYIGAKRNRKPKRKDQAHSIMAKPEIAQMAYERSEDHHHGHPADD